MRKVHVYAEALPELRRAIGRDVEITYLSVKPRSRRAKAPPIPMRHVEHLARSVSPHVRTVLPFERADGRRRGPIEMLTSPVSVVCRATRLVFANSIQERIVVEEISVVRFDAHGQRFAVTSGPIPALVFNESELTVPDLRPGDRMRLVVRNISRDRRRRLWIHAAFMLEVRPSPVGDLPLWAAPWSPWSAGSLLPMPPVRRDGDES